MIRKIIFKKPTLVIILGGLIYLISCMDRNVPKQTKVAKPEGLKDYYKDYFPIGVAVSPEALLTDEGEFIVKHFNSVTAENAMKMGPIHPEEYEYNFYHADKIVDFAVMNKMKIRGHTLCWHEQTPDWLFVDKKGNQVTKEVLLERLKKHINEVVGRYKGKIYAWDVVNEAIADNSNEYLRNSIWYKICGEDFIIKAFEYAHAADPNAKLFYNDYNAVRPEKRDRIYKLLKSLKDRGVPIHGMGIQGHWNVFEPSEADLREALDKYVSLGLEIQVTELDVSVHPWEKETRDRRPDEDDAFTPEKEQKQLEMYKMVFRVFRDYKDKITGITFWNISDRHSWLDYYPVRGRKNYPLLFDADLKPKKAYWEVVNF
jgi:endo-1,4-beta-xylanase